MRGLGLAAFQPRVHKVTTIPGEEPVASHLIEREFTADQPRQRLVGDITYQRTGENWLHLATVIDLATRMAGGWQLAEHMSGLRELTLDPTRDYQPQTRP